MEAIVRAANALWEAVRGMFGGKGGATKIGSANSASSATAGENGLAVSANRDAYVFTTGGPAAEDQVDLTEVERTMPDLFTEMRKDLADQPYVRDFIVMEEKAHGYNGHPTRL